MSEPRTNYTQGYSESVQATHAARTVESDASFLVPHIKPTDRILDVGCGPGTITLGFAALVPQGAVTGVDISEAVPEKARENFTSSSEKENSKISADVSFAQADLLSSTGLPFEDNTFDVVFSSQLFPHLSTYQSKIEALKEMRRVLKRGGILATRDAAHLHFYPVPPAVPAQYDLNVLWAGNMLRPLRTSHLPGGDMPRLFHETGFRLENIKVSAGTTTYTDESARRWFANVSQGRLQEGETFRESWREAGITDQEVEDTKEALDRWASMEGAWYVVVQAQVLGWKTWWWRLIGPGLECHGIGTIDIGEPHPILSSYQ